MVEPAAAAPRAGGRTGAAGSTSTGLSSSAAAVAAAAAAAATAAVRKATTALAAIVQRDEELEDVGEDELLPVDWMPGEDEPVKEGRLYRLDGVLLDSDDDPDGEENATVAGGDFHVMGADEAGYGVSLLQAAVEDTAIASVLPSADIVDDILGGTIPYAADAAGREHLCDKLSEDLMMLQLFIERVRGPDFVAWPRRDGALL